jgi:GNAT superfamily N-acetyltransferase
MICKDNTGLAGPVETILIRRADESDVERLVVFMLQFRQELYPMLDPQRIPQDLIHFKKNYLDAALSSVYIAEDQDKQLIGSIAMRAYDDRFEDLFALPEGPVVEVQKLFVLPSFRRQRIASSLFEKLLESAKRKGISTLYLHTHPFLPGAEEFWHSKHFDVIHRDQRPVFFTIHMRRIL